MTTTAAPSPSTDRAALPAWLVVLIVILALAVAGYLGYRQFYGSTAEGVVLDVGTVPERQQAPTFARMLARNTRRAVPPVDGVQAFGANVRVQAGNFVAMLSPQQATGKGRIQINHRDETSPDGESNLAGGETGQILTGLRELNRNTARADELKLTPDQRQKLQAIPGRRTLVVAPDGEAKLRDAWSKYFAAPDAAAKKTLEPPLVAALNEVGESSLAATKAEFEDRAAKVKAILTAEQLAGLTK